MHQIELAELSKHLPTVLDSALAGEVVLITQQQKPVLQLTLIEEVPADKPKPRRRRGSAAGLVVIAADFDELLPELQEYMQ